MTTQQHPAQFDWATELLDAEGHVTLSAKEANEIGARLRSMGEKLKAYEDLDEATSDVQLLRMGYAAARLEIESLQARIKTMAEEHADELTVAHLDGRMRVAQPAGAQQSGVAYAALPDDDRDYMRKVVAVAVTMLFDGYKGDVTRVFSTGELSEFVTITAAMGWERVEDIYRRAWDLLSLPVRASHRQAPAQAAHSSAAQTANCTYPACQIASGCGGACGRQLAQPAPAAVAGEPFAWADDGSLRSGSTATAHRVVTNETKKGMPKAAADSFSIPLYTTPQPTPQEAQEPVAWRVHPFDYGVGSEGVYATTHLVQQRDVWVKRGWKVEPLYTVPQPSPASQGDVLDAARYRWLRKHRSIDPYANPSVPWVVRCEFQPIPTTTAIVGDVLDAAIDAARKEKS